MSAKRTTGLGRGFESLIPTDLLNESFDPTAGEDEKVSDLRHILTAEIHADPDQPRRHFDDVALDELAASIREHGILQPIVVTADTEGYKIVAGERRFRAAKMAGLDKIPALVRTLSDQHRLELSLIENIQRRDLNPLETATAYQKLRDQFNMTLEQIGDRVGGKSMSAVSNKMRLLGLDEAVKTALFERKITEGQARPLIGVDKKIIDEILPKILKEEWSARRIEQFIVQMKKDKKANRAQEPKAMPQAAFEKETASLIKKLSTDVRVRTNTKGAGRIVIAFKDENEFHRLQQLLERND